MPINDFHTFVESATRLAKNAVVLGLTDYVDDENPLWATLDAADGRIRKLGGNGGSHGANCYLFQAVRMSSA